MSRCKQIHIMMTRFHLIKVALSRILISVLVNIFEKEFVSS